LKNVTITRFINARIFDGVLDECLDESTVVVEGGTIVEVSSSQERPRCGEVIDLRGATLMPGLIDAHCHVLGSSLRVSEIDTQPLTYVSHHAARMLGHALRCGFTTLRDVGGGDAGTARALEEGLIEGPRLFYAGRALSMTGGHGDFRDPTAAIGGCQCAADRRVSVIVDGLDAVRAAAREELRRGAHHLKLMMSGGVLSPSDPLWMDQFSDEEVTVAVEEAVRRRKYIAAHCHPATSIARAARLGVRSIEHATLIDAASADAVKAAGAYAVPTLVIGRALLDGAAAAGLPAWAAGKLKELSDQALSGLELMHRAGLNIGFGTDLLGPLYVHQAREFNLRRQVQPAIAILRAATSVNAEMMQQPTLGRIAVGCEADLIAVDGDPLADVGVLAEDGRRLVAIMIRGRLVKRPAA
jgi:imidazolonepropionase-like amidohydrolase